MDQKSAVKILTNPIEFYKYIRGEEPYPYQKEFLQCKSRFISMRQGRQTGKTTAVSIYALYKAFTEPDYHILIVAPVQRQARHLFSKIKIILDSFPFIRNATIKNTESETLFKNGSSIRCLTAKSSVATTKAGDTSRGFTANMIIYEEAAMIPDDAFDAIQPSISTTQGRVIMISTPKGKVGKFYETFGDAEWENFHVRASDCPKHDRKELEKIKASQSEYYAQEYDAEFIEGMDEWFPITLIRNCFEDRDEIYGPTAGRVYYMGIDVARQGKDETVYIIGERVGDKLIAVKYITTSKKPTTDVIGRVQDLHSIYKFQNIFIDASPLGQGVFDVLAERGLPIIPQDFHLKNKSDLYKNLKTFMEQGRLRYVYNDKLITQLQNMRYEYTEGRILKISAPSKQHDDFPDALALLSKALSFLQYDSSDDVFANPPGWRKSSNDKEDIWQ